MVFHASRYPALCAEALTVRVTHNLFFFLPAVSPHGNVKTKQTSLQAHVMAKRFAQANLEEDESSAGGAFDSPMRAGEHKFQSSTQPDGTSSDPSTD
jgi:hypothetical protein